MEIRYFFVKDRVASKEVTIEHCPTEDMLADYFTKPLQGAQFKKLRDIVMNVAPSSKYYSDQRSVLSPGEQSADDSNGIGDRGKQQTSKAVRFATDLVERGRSLLGLN